MKLPPINLWSVPWQRIKPKQTTTSKSKKVRATRLSSLFTLYKKRSDNS